MLAAYLCPRAGHQRHGRFRTYRRAASAKAHPPPLAAQPLHLRLHATASPLKRGKGGPHVPGPGRPGGGWCRRYLLRQELPAELLPLPDLLQAAVHHRAANLPHPAPARASLPSLRRWRGRQWPRGCGGRAQVG